MTIDASANQLPYLLPDASSRLIRCQFNAEPLHFLAPHARKNAADLPHRIFSPNSHCCKGRPVTACGWSAKRMTSRRPVIRFRRSSLEWEVEVGLSGEKAVQFDYQIPHESDLCSLIPSVPLVRPFPFRPTQTVQQTYDQTPYAPQRPDSRAKHASVHKGVTFLRTNCVPLRFPFMGSLIPSLSKHLPPSFGQGCLIPDKFNARNSSDGRGISTNRDTLETRAPIPDRHGAG